MILFYTTFYLLPFSTFQNTTEFYHSAIKQDIFMLKERKLIFLLPQHLVFEAREQKEEKGNQGSMP